MPGRSVPVVIVPRWTTFSGPGDFFSMPLAISAYDRLVLSYMRGNLVGTTPGLLLLCQESNDLDAWTDCGGSTPSSSVPFVEDQFTFDLTKAWLRFGVSPVGASTSVTCYAMGFFELREK
jgi:hypothetical protein